MSEFAAVPLPENNSWLHPKNISYTTFFGIGTPFFINTIYILNKLSCTNLQIFRRRETGCAEVVTTACVKLIRLH